MSLGSSLRPFPRRRPRSNGSAREPTGPHLAGRREAALEPHGIRPPERRSSSLNGGGCCLFWFEKQPGGGATLGKRRSTVCAGGGIAAGGALACARQRLPQFPLCPHIGGHLNSHFAATRIDASRLSLWVSDPPAEDSTSASWEGGDVGSTELEATVGFRLRREAPSR
jgi:hypothetical protein